MMALLEIYPMLSRVIQYYAKVDSRAKRPKQELYVQRNKSFDKEKRSHASESDILSLFPSCFSKTLQISLFSFNFNLKFAFRSASNFKFYFPFNIFQKTLFEVTLHIHQLLPAVFSLLPHSISTTTKKLAFVWGFKGQN
jgi:hypothetical protein